MTGNYEIAQRQERGFDFPKNVLKTNKNETRYSCGPNFHLRVMIAKAD